MIKSMCPFQPKQQPGGNVSAGRDHHYSAIAPADEFEAGSVFHAGSKKQNLNHLLNFQFEPRGQKGGQGGGGRGGGAGNYVSSRGGGKKRGQDLMPKPKYIKEQYRQAK